MKKLLILAYVLMVAGLSITARANENSPLLIDSIQHDQEAQIIRIEGQYPNPCFQDPAATLSLDKNDQLQLGVVGATTADICISIVGPRFMLAVDPHVLKSELSRLRLDVNGVHQIYDANGQLVAEIDFSEIFFTIAFAPTSISGSLAQDENGLYLVDDLDRRINIQSPLEGIDSLSGEDVTLTGHMNTHSVSRPVLNSNKPELQFIATGVSFSVTD